MADLRVPLELIIEVSIRLGVRLEDLACLVFLLEDGRVQTSRGGQLLVFIPEIRVQIIAAAAIHLDIVLLVGQVARVAA